MSEQLECEIGRVHAGEPLVVTVRGEVDLATAPELESCIQRAFADAIDRSAFATRLRGYAGKADIELLAGSRAHDGFAGVTSSADSGVGGARRRSTPESCFTTTLRKRSASIDVAVDLAHQAGQRREAAFGPQVRDEEDLDVPAV